MNLLTKQKEAPRLRKQTYGCQGEGTVREFGKVMYILLYSKWITNKDLLYRHGTLLTAVPAWMGAAHAEEWIPVYAWLSPIAAHLTTTTLFISYNPTLKV